MGSTFFIDTLEYHSHCRYHAQARYHSLQNFKLLNHVGSLHLHLTGWVKHAISSITCKLKT